MTQSVCLSGEYRPALYLLDQLHRMVQTSAVRAGEKSKSVQKMVAVVVFRIKRLYDVLWEKRAALLQLLVSPQWLPSAPVYPECMADLEQYLTRQASAGHLFPEAANKRLHAVAVEFLIEPRALCP
jgi:hypothetical protein